MEAANTDNYTLVVDLIDLWVAPIECLGSVYFRHNYLMLLHCDLGIVVSQIGHPVEPYWLSLVEIGELTSYENKRWS
jgi:hypothetical protein